MRRSIVCSLVAVMAVAGGLVVRGQESSQAHTARAKVALRDAEGTKVGWARFTVKPGSTDVEARLYAGMLTPGDAFHGFHVHANNDPANGKDCQADPAAAPSTWFTSADGHLGAAAGATHGHHAGDLPPLLLAADGSAWVRFTTGRVSVRDLVGKALVVHAGPDNLGHVPTGTAPDAYTPNSPAATTKTANTGNAGDRLACGVIRLHH